MFSGKANQVLLWIISGSLLMSAVAAAFRAGGLHMNTITAGQYARRALPVAVSLLAVGLVVASGCMALNSRGAAPMVPDPVVTTVVTITAGATPADTPAPQGGACSAGYQNCNGFCRDTSADIGNCGGCGKSCPDQSTCRDSRCFCKEGYSASQDGKCLVVPTTVPTTAVSRCREWPGSTLCGSQCVFIDRDPGYCGSCNYQCTGTQTCVNGQCVSPATTTVTTSGTTGCSSGQTACGSSCVNTDTDNQNCGGCGKSCTGGKSCSAGTCKCPSGKTDCGGSCVNADTDNQNCGKCGHSCTGGKTCSAGTCKCPSGQTACEWGCVDLSTSPQSCGICDNYCDSRTQICCNGKCTDYQTDNNNCGSCRQTCQSGTHCSAGTCVSDYSYGGPIGGGKCAYGMTYCNGGCVNLNTNNNNCGSCGKACKSNEHCSYGNCVIDYGYPEH